MHHDCLTDVVPGSSRDRVLNHIVWRNDPPPARWQPVPTWFERLTQAAISVRALLPASFLGSGLTEATYRGASVRHWVTGVAQRGRSRR